MLKPKQEKFVQNIVKGMSQREAYRDAYQADYDENAIDNNASKLLKKDEVQTRYKELMEELEDKAIMTAKERMKWLTDVVNDVNQEDMYTRDSEGNLISAGTRKADINTKIKAIDTLNKMSGQYTTKLEGNIGVTTIKVDITDE